MKKMILAAILMIGTVAQAASSEDLVISGTVALINDIKITPTIDATALDITGGESNQLVAGVEETSNNLNGYSISMRSANASKLVHSVDPSKSTGYTVSYDGAAPITLTTSDVVVKSVPNLSGLTTATSNVNVNVTAYNNAPAGTYSDTITVSIAAN